MHIVGTEILPSAVLAFKHAVQKKQKQGDIFVTDWLTGGIYHSLGKPRLPLPYYQKQCASKRHKKPQKAHLFSKSKIKAVPGNSKNTHMKLI